MAINVLNPAADLEDALLITSDDPQTIVGEKTFNRGSGVAPFKVEPSDAAVVSNLDADKFDGQHGAYYRDASNLNAGTIPDARFPDPLPALSGQNLSNLNAAALVTGDVPQARVSHIFPTQSFRGLHLRTDPDADNAHKQVWASADEVVFDDGTRLALPRRAADITEAGAGGLDTGVESTAVWYEIYAIAKEDSTTALLLHRAKDYFLDQSFTTTPDGSKALRNATGFSADRLAQGVTFATAGEVPFVDIMLKRTGAVSGRVWVTVEADVAGSPSGAPLATSDKLDASTISTSNQLIRFVFRAPATVTAALHHLVIYGDYTLSDTVNISVAGVVAGGYAGGVTKRYNGISWLATDTTITDAYFKAHVTRNDTAVTMPSGYTKKAKIGYVFNNSIDNFVPFTQLNRRVVPLIELDLGTTTATIPTLLSLSAFLPPVPTSALFMVANSGASNQSVVAPVPDGYTVSNVGVTTQRLGGGLALITYNAGATQALLMAGVIATEYQAVYIFVNAGTGGFWINEWELP